MNDDTWCRNASWSSRRKGSFMVHVVEVIRESACPSRTSILPAVGEYPDVGAAGVLLHAEKCLRTIAWSNEWSWRRT